MDPATVGRVTAPNRDAVLQFGIQQALRDGWRVESTGPGFAVLVIGSNSGDVLHVVLILFTCGLWIPFWLLIRHYTGEQRAILTVEGNRAVLKKGGRPR